RTRSHRERGKRGGETGLVMQATRISQARRRCSSISIRRRGLIIAAEERAGLLTSITSKTRSKPHGPIELFASTWQKSFPATLKTSGASPQAIAPADTWH